MNEFEPSSLDVITDLENTIRTKEKLKEIKENLDSTRNKISTREFQLSIATEEEKKKKIEEELSELKEKRDSLIIEAKAQEKEIQNNSNSESNNNGPDNIPDEEELDMMKFVYERLIKDERQRIKDYSKFLSEILDFVEALIRALQNDSYQVVKFGDVLQKTIVKESKKDSRMPIVYLLKIWEIELGTVCDYREHIGLKEEYYRISQNLRYLAHPDNHFLDEDRDKQDELKQFLQFLKWKYEFSLLNNEKRQTEGLELKDIDEILSKYDGFVKPANFFRDCIEAEEDDHEARKRVKQSSLISNIKSAEKESYPEHCLIERWAFATYLKDFVDPSKENLQTLEDVKDSVLAKKTKFDKYDELLEKNSLFFENHYLSYLVDWYEKETLLSEASSFIEKRIINVENNKYRNSYFKYYKLGCFYLEKFKKLVKETSETHSTAMIDALKNAKLYHRKAKKLFLKDGRFSYPFRPHFIFSKQYEIFSVSTFIQHKTHNDLERIEDLGNEIASLESFLEVKKIKKKAEEDFSTTLSNEQKQNIKRIVEVLAIFSALVLFASGSIQIYSSIETLQQAVIFTLFFGASLSFFAFLIYLIVRVKKEKSILLIFGGVCLLTIICGYYFLFEKEDVPFQRGEEKKIEINLEQNNENLSEPTKEDSLDTNTS